MISGNKKTALQEPHSVVLTETAARKYFNSTDVVGKILLINNDHNYTVTGVIKNIPTQSHFHFDFFFAASELDNSRDDSWLNTNFHTYLLLKPKTDIQYLEKQLNRTLLVNTTPQFRDVLNMSKEEFEKAGNSIYINLMPLTGVHLHSNIADELEANGNIQYIYIYSAIAVFILLIACVNFMNLSTARSANRAKEVGMRKVLGGVRGNLITQFISESVLMSFFSIVVSVTIVVLTLPYFNQLAGKNISPEVLTKPGMLSAIFMLAIFIGLISGSYPAFFLSAFKPIQVLKGNVSNGFRGSLIRNVLVVFQFSISIVLMIGTVVIFNQLNYLRNKDIGFNKDRILVIENTYSINTKAFCNELSKMPGIEDITVTGFLPIKGSRSDRGFVASPVFDGKNFSIMQQWSVDENYIPTLQISMKSGRNFSYQYPSDSNAVILNEAAASFLGKGNPVNKKLYLIKNLQTREVAPSTVIGVISDFNFNSLHEKITPLVLKLEPDKGSIAVRIKTGNIRDLLVQINSIWKGLAPAEPFSYSFLDEQFNRQYNAEQRTGAISLVFSALAICIACLGLFGLVTYAAEQRFKEIGIRKVLGASVPDIISLLSRDFVKLIIISICIASPIAWWTMSEWLQGFAFRINISWWIFIIAGTAALLIASITVGFQAI
ncbi:MAG: cell division protein FtsX, partial [Flavobacterium psychrophilum]